MRYIFLIIICLLLSCSTKVIDNESINEANRSNKVHIDTKTLSYIRAYLLIGNIKKAEQHMDLFNTSQLTPEGLLTLAELNAAKGNSEEAQKTFLMAITNNQFDFNAHKNVISENLLDYLCQEKKWPALQGYAKTLTTNTFESNTFESQVIVLKKKNQSLIKIAQCFFDQQRWDEANKWLQQLDKTQPVSASAYLMQARWSIEKGLYSSAEELIIQFEQTKNEVNAKTLWVAIEIYLALSQPEQATNTGQSLRSLFPTSPYTRKYILLEKRDLLPGSGIITSITEDKTIQNPTLPNGTTHTIRSGETLYQLSKRYSVSLAQLLLLNPSLVIDDIAVGTQIKVQALN